MNTDLMSGDDDTRIGVPTAGRPPRIAGSAGSGSGPWHDDTIPVELRPDETGLGRPPQTPSDLAPLTPEDVAQLRSQEEQVAARELAEVERLIVSDPTGLGRFGWFSTPVVFTLLLGIGGVFGLFFLNQTLTLIQTLRAQPEWAQYVGFAGLGLFAGCVLYAGFRILFVYLRLRENRQLRLRGIEELSRRTRLRWLAVAKTDEARRQIETYLRSYPLDTEKDRRAMRALGLTDEAQARLAAVRAELLNPDRFTSTEQWFVRFRDGFQSELDLAADARIRYWGNRVWVVTAVAPNAAVDAGATLFYTFSMLGDLCQIYNLRAGRAGTAVLLGRVFFNAYLAGQGAEWEKIVEDHSEKLFGEALNAVGIGVSSNVVGKLLGKVGAKATTGYLNRVLLIRLGRYSMQLLRPVAKD